MDFKILVLAFLLRIGMIYYGLYHDKVMEVAYTDIDYSVFTQAAEYVTKGKSPYLKDTYKYTPLLSFLMIPNITYNILFGKILFCIFDIVVAIILFRITEYNMLCTKKQSERLISVLWLFNPLTMTISSRGNAEALQIFLVSSTLLLIQRKQWLLSGFVFGLSIHFKLYPIIYSLPILLYMVKPLENTKIINSKSFFSSFFHLAASMFQKEVIVFSLSSLTSFLGVGYLMYSMYGHEFIQHTYLFHMSRKDVQHNFSPYFYILRLTDGFTVGEVINKTVFIPQLLVVTLMGLFFHTELPLACFLQTFAFVMFNKVCTSQYFIWYIGLLPAAYSYLKIPVRTCVKLVIAWLASQGVWLFFAYLLEFRKYNVVIYVWLASLLFLTVNMYILYQCVEHAVQRKKTERRMKKNK